MTTTTANLREQILEHAQALPEGTPLTAKELLHLGGRAAVDQTLSRLATSGALLRVARGLYVVPVASRFGSLAPSTQKVLGQVAELRGETYAPHGAAAANALGLTTQVPVRQIYLTTGPSWQMNLGGQVIELCHAPKWQLVAPGRKAGMVIRALAWLGQEQAGEGLRELQAHLSTSEAKEIAAMRPRLPTWMAETVSPLAA